ncbi:hypothetical protein BH11PLA2_BH11PLA2_22040 [soil metagenome]
MTTEIKTEAIEALIELSQRYPHWRLGQLLANVAGWADRSVWDLEDDEFLEAARRHLDKNTVNSGDTVAVGLES